jgi:neutral amino acid transport system permease protein
VPNPGEADATDRSAQGRSEAARGTGLSLERGAERGHLLKRLAPWAMALAVIAGPLVGLKGVRLFTQTTVFGLVAGSYYALGALGLTLVYGILKLVNFAHGDLVTVGAYAAYAANVGLGVPIVPAALVAVLAGILVSLALEFALVRPLRKRGSGKMQSILLTIGLGFILRFTVQLLAGTAPRNLNINVTTSIRLGPVRVGTVQLIVMCVSLAALLAVGLAFRLSSIGKQMRAVSENPELAATTGVNTDRVVVTTWVVAGGLAGLAGVLATAAVGSLTPNFGEFLLLNLFAAVILGGVGNPFGALAGGLLLGLAQEWSVMVLDSRWKLAVGFGVLFLCLVIRPQGLLGRARSI